VSPVKYELGFYMPEDDILHSHPQENLKSYIRCYLLSQLKSQQVAERREIVKMSQTMDEEHKVTITLPTYVLQGLFT
jgi:hypothetical protein